ncbi:MAG: aldose 1-epimerase family protein [Clostridiales bacterium]|nr:aldose 1-epimerase family protein [Clostridiales bacterium]
MITIENQVLSASINEYGAELSSLKKKNNGREYLWQGNPDVWSGRSPILFPIVGALKENSYFYKGKRYFLPRHGFARKNSFTPIEKKEERASFLLESSSFLKSVYPDEFSFIVSYSLNETTLTVQNIVTNIGTDDMYFSIGAHPGFQCPIGSRLEFETEETVTSERLNSEGLTFGRKDPFLNHSKEVVLTRDIFLEDVHILSHLKSSYLKLLLPDNTELIKFHFGSVPYLGLWSKPAHPFVCIEPWYGIADAADHEGDFTTKRGIICLHPKENFTFSYAIEIL